MRRIEGGRPRLVSGPRLAPDGCHFDVRCFAGPPVERRMSSEPRILVFDSGVGGLTVYREIVRVRPDAHIVYVADDAGFPYGRIGRAELIDRLLGLMGELIERHRPDLVVIACNTASTLVLPHLRLHFSVPFVGTVPAIKPACAASQTKRVSVLGTEATVMREYTRALVDAFAAGCEVKLVGSAQLAGLAEKQLRGEKISDHAIATELLPCFLEPPRTDTIVLACTHFPLLLDRLERIAPWPVRFIDPAPAIARRIVDLIGDCQPVARRPVHRAIFTSGRAIEPALVAALYGFGLHPAAAPDGLSIADQVVRFS
jgi:glutamate racemase